MAPQTVQAPHKRLLFGPGPSRRLREVFGTHNECTIPIFVTGSSRMETAVGRGRRERPQSPARADGSEIAGGWGPLAGKIFRIGLMGPLATESNVEMFLGAFKEALKA